MGVDVVKLGCVVACLFLILITVVACVLVYLFIVDYLQKIFTKIIEETEKFFRIIDQSISDLVKKLVEEN